MHYHRSLPLSDKKIVVLGATGGVGEGIVRSLLLQGATVFACGRSQDKINDLLEYVSDIPNRQLFTARINLHHEVNGRLLQRNIEEMFPEPNAVVASIGSWCEGRRLIDMEMNAWQTILQNNITAHFIAMKYLVPTLKRPGGQYIHVNGFAAEMTFPYSAPVAAAAAAQKSMALTLREEMADEGIDVYELILGPINTRRRFQQSGDWHTAENIGEYIASLVSGDAADLHETVHRLFKKTPVAQRERSSASGT